MKRKRIGSSHEGRYTYWLDRDLYIYQRDETAAPGAMWVGWLCSLSAWNETFCKASWIIGAPADFAL